MINQNSRSFLSMPEVTKNLLIINIIVFVADMLLSRNGNGFMDRYLALHFVYSNDFMPHQVITYMFMHGSLSHLFFNMFALFMFGRTIEACWGSKRFLTFYLVTGIGAACLQLIINYVQYTDLISQIPSQQLSEILNMVKNEGATIINSGKNYSGLLGSLNEVINVPMVGASGAIFGILAAFGFMFPNSELIMFPIPIPIKAKYFVIGYGCLELSLGVMDRGGDNVAHFAHIGGLITGVIMLLYWKKRGILYGKDFRGN